MKETRYRNTLQEMASTPDAIEERSFAIIDAETGSNRPFSGDAWHVARRLVHTTGDISLLSDLYLPDASVAAGVRAVLAGAPIFTDTEMVKAGIPVRRLTATGNKVTCLLSQPQVAEEATRLGCTRSRAGLLLAAERLSGAIVAVGNAPTSLLALLEHLDGGGGLPALVIGMPVGFVNAEESKELLIEARHRHPGLHCLVLRGRRGGSPLAAATVNALAVLASSAA